MKILNLSILTTIALSAGGYKLPEQSLNAVALGTAYLAHTMGADTAYYNPANMAFMKDKRFLESSLTLVHLPSSKYIPSTATSPTGGTSKSENIPVPNIHYVAKAFGAWRWGMSVIVPAGLTKRWESPYQKLYAEEFTLKNVELNPSFSYKINDKLAIGGGLRMVYSEGIVNSDGGAIAPVKREMEGNTLAFGYNLALAYRPSPEIHLAMTYRSEISLKEKGQANLYFGGVGKQYDADVTVPLPASLNLAISKTWNDDFTIELNYERSYWSAYKALNFNYDQTLPLALQAPFDDPIPRNWKDSNSFRIAATYELKKFTLMAGFALDESPVPDKTIGFELPDSDAKVYSAGLRYHYSEALSFGISLLYTSKESRKILAGVADNPIVAQGGEFTEGGAILTTLGVAYTF